MSVSLKRQWHGQLIKLNIPCRQSYDYDVEQLIASELLEHEIVDDSRGAMPDDPMASTLKEGSISPDPSAANDVYLDLVGALRSYNGSAFLVGERGRRQIPSETLEILVHRVFHNLAASWEATGELESVSNVSPECRSSDMFKTRFNITDHQEEDHILIWVLEALESRGFVKAESSQEQRLEQEHNPIPLESYRNGIHESPPSESNWSEVSDKLSSGVDPIPLENIVLLTDEHEANLSDGQHSLDHGIISKNEVHTDCEPQVYEFSEPSPPSWEADEYERNAEVLKGQITSGQTRVADLQVRLDELVVPSKIMQVPSALPNLICNSLKCHKTCVNGCSVRAQDSEGNWYYEDLEDNRTIRKHACPACSCSLKYHSVYNHDFVNEDGSKPATDSEKRAFAGELQSARQELNELMMKLSENEARMEEYYPRENSSKI